MQASNKLPHTNTEGNEKGKEKETEQKETETVPLERVICPICLEVCKEPKSLGCCMGVFCAKCIRQYVEDGAKPCPICRKSLSLTPDDIDRLPINFVIAELIYKMTDKQDRSAIPPCDECDDVTTAACETCGKCLCDLHAKAHIKAKATANHKLVGPEKAHELRRMTCTLQKESKEKEEEHQNEIELNRFRTCRRCRQSFTIITNNDKACRYHPDVRFLFLISSFSCFE
jgi:hypothetical protein